MAKFKALVTGPISLNGIKIVHVKKGEVLDKINPDHASFLVRHGQLAPLTKEVEIIDEVIEEEIIDEVIEEEIIDEVIEEEIIDEKKTTPSYKRKRK